MKMQAMFNGVVLAESDDTIVVEVRRAPERQVSR